MSTTVTFGDDRLQATLEHRPDQLWLTLRAPATGTTRGPVPLLHVEVYDKAEFRVNTLTKYRIDLVQPLPDGAHIVIGDSFRRLQLGLWLRIENGELVVTLPLAELYENKAEVYRTFTAIILPGLLQTTGKLILPLNTGIVCNVAGKPQVADRFMIYGEQSRWELLPTLPVAAAGDWLVLATGGAAETECHVATDGAGMGTVTFAMSFRQFWPDPVEPETRVLRYAPIPAKADPVVFVAKRLRRHVVEDLQKPTLQQRLSESPELAYLHDAYIMKLFYAVEHNGIMMQGTPQAGALSFKQVMNFAEAGALLRKVRAAGIDKVVTQSVGWNPRGHDGLWPTRFPIEERLGGESGFRQLLATGHSLGFQMNVHDNYLSAYRSSPDFDPELLIHDQWGGLMGLGEWGGGITYIHWALTLPAERLEGEIQGVKALGLTGAGYIDGMGNPLYRDYHPRHRGTRTGYARGTQRIIEAAKKVYGAAGTECGFLYAALPADSMVQGGAEWMLKACPPHWPVTALLEKRVPLWHLALHGLLIHENHGETWGAAMNAILLGGHPRTEWSANPGVMPVLTDGLLAKLKAHYDLVLKKFGHLQTLELTDYHEPNDGITTTRFADGTEVTADFNHQELIVNGQRVDRPAALA
ncbi:MAG: hypothetical protein PCFJNLEI_02051 [Verrucomicrobiae bacterium]|nr:hypothetical protein [Verrucomicrobiae bacterium]